MNCLLRHHVDTKSSWQSEQSGNVADAASVGPLILLGKSRFQRIFAIRTKLLACFPEKNACRCSGTFELVVQQRSPRQRGLNRIPIGRRSFGWRSSSRSSQVQQSQRPGGFGDGISTSHPFAYCFMLDESSIEIANPDTSRLSKRSRLHTRR